MANIEAAIKLFIYETKRPVSLEVVATTIADTHLGKRIRFRMWEQKSQTLFTDYFDALTETRSDYADFENIYKKLMSKFELNVTS
jgi:phenylalanine-4-hydroxylase